ncbi:MAG: peptidylprolyl isomerase, partial [Psychrosphaera sp.]|nr:peptidylprolyl isomerase [Psychrosphaera sp.]
DPVFSAKVFNELKKDQLSEPFQSSFGFHIVKIIEGPMVVKKPLDKVKGDIRHQLRKAAKATELARLTSAITINRQQ